MKTLISLALIAGVLTGCVVPVPMNNTNTAMYPGYAPAYRPQIPQAPVLSPYPAPGTGNSVLTTAKAIPVSQPKPTPVAYNTAKPQVLTVPTISPVKNQPTPQAHQSNTTINHAQTRSPGNKPQNLNWLAQRIFQNQTGGNPERLIQWNEKENFAVLGIGEFIWYPAGKRGRFQETFPAYLNYAKANGTPLPAWIAQRPSPGGPWANTTMFRRAQNDVQMKELRQFMQKTLNLQANFMAMRLRHTMPRLLSKLPANERSRVMNNYQTVLKTPGGLYPLLDYVQFKGDGSNPAERYKGKGWGLLQVLQNMQDVKPGAAALAEFMRAADDTLVTRIANAPADRREARMLADWLKRVNTYRPAQRASR
ncbi:MAG: hypothetical protein ACPG51_05145 [Thiolinea sp.]